MILEMLIVDRKIEFSHYSLEYHRDMKLKCDGGYIENSNSIHELQHE